VTKEELLRLTATIEAHSNHPIARAIEEFAAGDTVHLPISHVEEVPGLGLKGTVNGQQLLVGNTRLLERYSVAFPSVLHQITETLVVVAMNRRYLGHITISDVIIEGAINT